MKIVIPGGMAADRGGYGPARCLSWSLFLGIGIRAAQKATIAQLPAE
jgi:hypothetical protein